MYNATSIPQRREAIWGFLENGYEYCGEGVARIAFTKSGEYVYKVAKSREMNEFETRRENRKTTLPSRSCDGARQNRKEKEMWNDLKADFLAPIVDIHPEYLWAKQPFVTMGELEYGAVKEFKKRLDNENVYVNDVKSSNIGKLNGDRVLIDYGLGYRVHEEEDQSKMKDFA